MRLMLPRVKGALALPQSASSHRQAARESEESAGHEAGRQPCTQKQRHVFGQSPHESGFALCPPRHSGAQAWGRALAEGAQLQAARQAARRELFEQLKRAGGEAKEGAAKEMLSQLAEGQPSGGENDAR